MPRRAVVCGHRVAKLSGSCGPQETLASCRRSFNPCDGSSNRCGAWDARGKLNLGLANEFGVLRDSLTAGRPTSTASWGCGRMGAERGPERSVARGGARCGGGSTVRRSTVRGEGVVLGALHWARGAIEQGGTTRARLLRANRSDAWTAANTIGVAQGAQCWKAETDHVRIGVVPIGHFEEPRGAVCR